MVASGGGQEDGYPLPVGEIPAMTWVQRGVQRKSCLLRSDRYTTEFPRVSLEIAGIADRTGRQPPMIAVALDKQPFPETGIPEAELQQAKAVTMIKVKSRGNETVDQMLRRFKKLCEKEGLIKDMKRVSYYEKPSEKRRRRLRKAQSRALKIATEAA